MAKPRSSKSSRIRCVSYWLTLQPNVVNAAVGTACSPKSLLRSNQHGTDETYAHFPKIMLRFHRQQCTMPPGFRQSILSAPENLTLTFSLKGSAVSHFCA